MSDRQDDIIARVGTLSEDEALILSLYFGEDGNTPLTIAEIAQKLSRPEDQVARIKHRAINKIVRQH
ncbi:sigma factor-like helix-turn-helix DNA-binding protein [Patescibacteria group bacterium]